jgi:peroxiredoxin Q/BCP
MAQLRQNYAQFAAADTEVVVVGPEGPKQFRSYWQEHDLPFVGLPDPQHSVLKQYGQEVNLFKLGRMPAQVLIDKSGLVRYAYYGKSMADIPQPDEMLELIEKINATQGLGAQILVE